MTDRTAASYSDDTPRDRGTTTGGGEARSSLTDETALSDETIRRIASAELVTSKRNYDNDLEANRESAYTYYRALPQTLSYPNCGDDNTPSSTSAQSTDVSDAVEWILPAVMKLLSEAPPVSFDAVNQADEDQAELETEYTHLTFFKRCNGYVTLYSAVKDALLLKNGVTATWWDRQKRSTKETYTDLTEVDLGLLLSPDDNSEITLLSQDSREEEVIDPVTGIPLPDQDALRQVQSEFQQATQHAMMMRMPPPPPPDIRSLPTQKQTLYDVEIRRVYSKGMATVDPIPPEDFRVRFDHNSIMLGRARFCSYTRIRSKSDLVAEGYDTKTVDELPLVDSRIYDDGEKYARLDVEREAYTTRDGKGDLDPSLDEVETHICYMLLDINGDGIAEHIRVDLAGRDGEYLLEWNECTENPFSAGTPFIAAHKFYGYSLYDKLKNIQDQKTKLLRQIDYNVDLINNPPRKVLHGQANLMDVLTNRPGAIRRVKDMNALANDEVPNLAQNGFMLLEYLDKRRGERTGVDPDMQSMGTIPVGSETAHGIERLLSAKEELVGLIVRTLAETLVKDIYVKLRGLMLRHMDREELVKLKNKWVKIDPGNWKERTSSTVRVGLGTGDRYRKIKGLQMIIEQQMRDMAAGAMGNILTYDHMYRARAELINALGIGTPSEYYLDPDVLAQPETPEGKKANQALVTMSKRQQQAQAAAAQADPAAKAEQEARTLQAQASMLKAKTDMEKAKMEASQQEKDRMVDMAQFQKEMAFKYTQLQETINQKFAELAARYGGDAEKRDIDRGKVLTAAAQVDLQRMNQTEQEDTDE